MISAYDASNLKVISVKLDIMIGFDVIPVFLALVCKTPPRRMNGILASSHHSVKGNASKKVLF